jgi:ketosteroid isomerase-like protein
MSDDYLELTLTTDPASQLHWKAATKSEWLALIRSGEEKYESVHLTNLTVHLHGNVATVTGEYTQKGTRDHEDISSTGPYVDTWIKENGTWHIVSSVFP